jgi:hypothetical protein
MRTQAIAPADADEAAARVPADWFELLVALVMRFEDWQKAGHPVAKDDWPAE